MKKSELKQIIKEAIMEEVYSSEELTKDLPRLRKHKRQLEKMQSDFEQVIRSAEAGKQFKPDFESSGNVGRAIYKVEFHLREAIEAMKFI